MPKIVFRALKLKYYFPPWANRILPPTKIYLQDTENLNVIKNGGFDNTDFWITGGGWNITQGILRKDATAVGYTVQPDALIIGKTYEIHVDVGWIALNNDMMIELGPAAENRYWFQYAQGDSTVIFQLVADITAFTIWGNSGNTGSLDNIKAFQLD